VVQKVYFIDTSVVLHDPSSVEKLSSGGNIVVFSVYVLFQLDKAKKDMESSVGFNSRAISRLLDECVKRGRLNRGVSTESGGLIIADASAHEEIFKKELLGVEKTVDTRIIASAISWKKKHKDEKQKVVVVSKDINLRVAANIFEVFAEDYESDKKIKRLDELYTGLREITLPDKDANHLLTDLPRLGSLSLKILSPESNELLEELYPNQCLVITIAGKTVLAIYKKKKRELVWVKKPRLASGGEKKKSDDIAPRNIEQAFEYALLCDKEIAIVALSGKAGTGKTLISLLAATEQLGDYNQVLVYRPTIEMGKELGFRPGDLGEKFAPFTRPILDNLELISPEFVKKPEYNSDGIAQYCNGMLEIHPINFARGRSLHSMYVIIDEVQNLTRIQTKSLLTRAGENTKCVLTGDCSQIDNPYLDAVSNGLAITIERLKGQEFFGCIMLRKSERCDVVDMITELL